jgi:hypothetical protein
MESYKISTFVDFEKDVAARLTERGDDPTEKLVGVLFMREGQAVADNEILPSIPYFGIRSGDDIDFYFPGWRDNYVYIPGEVQTWTFDPVNFNKALELFEAESEWKYSGGIELLLMGMRKSAAGTLAIDLKRIIRIPISLMRERKLVESVEVLFERIFRFAREYAGKNAVADLALQETRVSALQGLADAIFGVLGKDAKDRLEYAQKFQIRDVSKRSAAVAIVRRHEERSGNPKLI